MSTQQRYANQIRELRRKYKKCKKARREEAELSEKRRVVLEAAFADIERLKREVRILEKTKVYYEHKMEGMREDIDRLTSPPEPQSAESSSDYDAEDWSEN